MNDDIATFGFAIDSKPAKDAADNLDRMAESSERAERNARQFEQQQTQMARAMVEMARVQDQQLALLSQLNITMSKVADNTDNFYQDLLNVTAILGTIGAVVGGAGYALYALGETVIKTSFAMKELSEQAAGLGVNVFKGIGDFAFNDMFTKLDVVITSSSKRVKEYSVELEVLSQRFGVASNEVTSFIQAGGQMGLSAERSVEMVSRLRSVLDDQTESARVARDTIRSLGVEISQGLTSDELFGRLSASLSQYQDSPDRLGVIGKIFGSVDDELLTSLKNGVEAISDTQRDINRIGEIAIERERERAREIEQVYRRRAELLREEFEAEDLLSARLYLSLGNLSDAVEDFWLARSYDPTESWWNNATAGIEEVIGKLVSLKDAAKESFRETSAAIKQYFTGEDVEGPLSSQDPNAAEKSEVFVLENYLQERSEQLSDLQLQRENWFTWNTERELEFYEETLQNLEENGFKEAGVYQSIHDRVVALRRARFEELRSIDEQQLNVALSNLNSAQERLEMFQEYVEGLDFGDMAERQIIALQFMYDRMLTAAEREQAMRAQAEARTDAQIGQIRLDSERRLSAERAQVGLMSQAEALREEERLIQESYANRIELANKEASAAEESGAGQLQVETIRAGIKVMREQMAAELAALDRQLSQVDAIENFRIKMQTDMARAVSVFADLPGEVRTLNEQLVQASQELALRYGEGTDDFARAFDERAKLINEAFTENFKVNLVSAAGDVNREIEGQRSLNAAYRQGGEAIKYYAAEREAERLIQVAVLGGLDIENTSVLAVIQAYKGLLKVRIDLQQQAGIDQQNQALDDQLDLLDLELSLLGEQSRLRNEELSLLADRQRLMQQFPGIEREQLDLMIKKLAEVRRTTLAIEDQRRASEELQQVFVGLSNGLESAFTSAWGSIVQEGKFQFDDFAGYLRDVFGNLSIDLARTLIIRPALGGAISGLFGQDVAQQAGLPTGGMNILSGASNIYSMLSGGPTSLANAFSFSSIGQSLGFSTAAAPLTAFSAPLGGVAGGATTAAMAGSPALLGGATAPGLTSMGTGLAAAAGPWLLRPWPR
jgi:hypothetical protein